MLIPNFDHLAVDLFSLVSSHCQYKTTFHSANTKPQLQINLVHSGTTGCVISDKKRAYNIFPYVLIFPLDQNETSPHIPSHLCLKN